MVQNLGFIFRKTLKPLNYGKIVQVFNSYRITKLFSKILNQKTPIHGSTDSD